MGIHCRRLWCEDIADGHCYLLHLTGQTLPNQSVALFNELFFATWEFPPFDYKKLQQQQHEPVVAADRAYLAAATYRSSNSTMAAPAKMRLRSNKHMSNITKVGVTTHFFFCISLPQCIYIPISSAAGSCLCKIPQLVFILLLFSCSVVWLKKAPGKKTSTLWDPSSSASSCS